MITFTHSGSFSNLERFFRRYTSGDIFSGLDKHGKDGVMALQSATPIDEGVTRDSWDYEIERTKNMCRISWTNSHVDDGVQIAVILQYGHGTGTGGYVQGRDYINPAIRPVFDRILNDIWAEVTK